MKETIIMDESFFTIRETHSQSVWQNSQNECDD